MNVMLAGWGPHDLSSSCCQALLPEIRLLVQLARDRRSKDCLLKNVTMSKNSLSKDGPAQVGSKALLRSLTTRENCSKYENNRFVLEAYCENVFFPKCWPKNSQKWVCLAGKILVNLALPICPILNPPNNHKKGKSEKRTKDL